MMEKVKDLLKKIPDWVKAVVASAVIVAVAVVVNEIVTNYIEKTTFDVVNNDFTCVYQIDNVDVIDKTFVITGWVFKLNEDSTENDFSIFLYNYNNGKKYSTKINNVAREDVNKYFLCEYDYTDSGFIAKIESSKLDLEKTNYEIIIRYNNTREAFKTGIYISDGKMVYAKPEDYKPLDVIGTDIENIVNDGILRVYRPDVGMYVYQYEGYLYWVADENYEFSNDEKNEMQYQLSTTQFDRLPEERQKNNFDWDKIIVNLEKNELSDINTGRYRVSKEAIPTQYSITKIWVGKYSNGWKWINYFYPRYEF